ncbi:MAG: BatA domain-containing protein [Candidatus Cyclobacteriaceae bacterium M2_1C_046]
MSFLNPGWLWGLFALAIPIIVHLFNFRKTRRIYFSNTQFIKKVKEASKSRRKLKHYLVLLSRMLFIFWLIMAFAQPFIPASKGALQSDKVYFYLDNSYSMNRASGEQITAFEEGMDYVRSLISIYPAGTDFYLLTNDFAPFSHAPHSAAQLQELLTEVQLTGVIRTTDEILSRWRSMQEIDGLGDYYFISDFQRSTKGLPQKTDTLMQVRLLPVFTESRSNVYIDTTYLDNPFLIGKERVRLYVNLKNDSDQPAEDVTVRIFLSDVQVASTTTDLGASATKTLNFDLISGANEQNTGRISIEEYPVTFDNDLYFVLDLGEKINVTEVRQQNTPTVISRVYGNKELFNLRSFHYNNFDYNSLETTDLLVLNQLAQLEPSFSIAVNNFMERGGQIVLIPNPDPDVSSYKNLFGTITSTDTIQQHKLLTPDFDNPFFSQVFEERDPAIDMPSAAPVITWTTQRSSLLQLNNGMPFLSKVNDQVFLFASPFEDEFTTMHKHALFVPVMYKIAALSSQGEQPLYHYLDERTLLFSYDSLLPSELFKLRQQDKEIIPVQRVSNQQLLLQLPAYEVDAGFYQLVTEERHYETIAFNINKAESILEPFSLDELKNVVETLPNFTLYESGDAEEFRRTLEKQFVGWSLWKYCLILSIIFLLAEILIIRFVP